MSAKNRNFRRRADSDDNDDTPSTTTNPSTTTKPSSKPSSLSSASAAAKTTTKPKKLLSFTDDEESELQPPSRSSSKERASSSSSSRIAKPSSLSSSHKLSRSKDRISSSVSSLPSNVQPQAGQYSREALLELKKNTKTLAPSRTSQQPSSAADSIFVLKGPVKPILNTGNDKILKEVDDLDEVDDVKEELSGLAVDKKSGDLMLDQATINRIKARRERLRKSGAAAPDFIALDSGSNHGAADGLSDEEPEFRGRIALIGEKMGSEKKGVFEELDDRGADDSVFGKHVEVDEEDEEDKIWEQEQVRKALGTRMEDGGARVSANVPVISSVQQQSLLYPAVSYAPVANVASSGLSIGGAVGAFQGLDAMPLSQQAEVARKALQDNVRRLKESYERTMSLLTSTDDNLSASLLNITSLEKSQSVAGEKFIYMQKLRDFVSVICDFLQDKAPFIEELEEQMQKLHEERASAILERRSADNEDEMMEVGPAINAAMAVFNKGGDNATMAAMATTAAQAAFAAVKEPKNLAVKLDEFGRDMNMQKRRDTERRAEARLRRKARADAKKLSAMEEDGAYQRIEGESSTDESDDETTAYQSKRDQILQTSEQIFSDASEEYSQLSVVKERLESWKKQYSSSYSDAYMSMSAPTIFSPYVRLELLKWDPLYEDADFYDMKWHSLLFNYGLPEDRDDFRPDDADADLIPGLVEKVALPILHHEIAHCWDMLSTRETKNAVSATNLIINYVPASSEALRDLLAVILTRLTEAVSNLVVPTWSVLVMKAVPGAARIAAYRFGRSVRLMRNICLWKDILAASVLEKLALDDLLGGKVLPHIRGISSNIHDAVTRTERVVASLAGVWAGPSVTGPRSQKLQPLVDHVLVLGRTLEKKYGSGVSENETSRLARRLKKMLVELNEYDKARSISRTFNLKEAL
ncbi:GCF, C-terminal [Dillenia turbinata]|uniref:GCF, C-terminal n=1 Tax=Dillenia turbinata TaxID=194707 RepID=A0AAN8URF0_9MAGN